MGFKIISTGVYLPERIVHVDQALETSSGGVIDSLFDGGGQYRLAGTHEGSTYMGAKAVEQALSKASIDPMSIDIALGFSFVPDYETPRDIYGILREAGCHNALAWSLDTACASFLSHIHLASILCTKKAKRILIVESSNWVKRAFGNKPLANAVGDGAGAIIVEHVDDGGSLIDIVERSNTKLFDFITMKETVSTGNSEQLTFTKNNRTIHKSITIVAETAIELLNKNGLNVDDINWTITHQPGMAAINKWHEIAGIPTEKNLNTYPLYGNMSAANIPITLDYFTNINPKIKRDDVILMFTAGSGVHPVAALIKY